MWVQIDVQGRRAGVHGGCVPEQDPLYAGAVNLGARRWRCTAGECAGCTYPRCRVRRAVDAVRQGRSGSRRHRWLDVSEGHLHGLPERQWLRRRYRYLLRTSAGRHQYGPRSEEHTSELQSLMRISYAVFCLKKKNQKISNKNLYTYM